MNEFAGVIAAMVSSGLGGTAIGATRYLIGLTDPLTLGAFRFDIGVVLLLPVVLLRRERWPRRRDWPAVAALGLLFFALFPVLFNASLIHTTAARGALALSTLPVLTMSIAALFGVERLTRRKSIGVLIAMGGVALALLAGLANAPPGAWRGDLLMVAGCALHGALQREREADDGALGPVAFTTFAMGVGAACLTAVAFFRGGFASVEHFGTAQWLAVLYLGIFGGAVVFILWAYALERTTPTRVAVSITVNPIMAALVGAMLLHEPVGWNLIAGLLAVILGIWVATTDRPAAPSQP